MTDQQKRFRWLLVLILVVIVVLAGLTIYTNSKFHVVSTNPSVDKVASVSPFFDINFNHNLKGKPSVISSPAIISSYQINGKVLDINLRYPLKLNTRYTITVLSVQDSSGHTITNKAFSFTTQYVQTSDLSKAQQQALLNKQTQYSEAHNDPILAIIPYSTLGYSLTPSYSTNSSGQTKVIVEAQLVITAADSDTPQDKQATVNQDEAEVQQYIESKGLNPANYTINYTY